MKLFYALLPILLAYLTAYLLRPISRRLARSTGVTRPAAAGAVLLGVLLLIVGGTVGIVWALARQAGELAVRLGEQGAVIVQELSEAVDTLEQWIPVRDAARRAAIAEALRSSITDGARQAISAITASLPGRVGQLLSSLPGIFFFLTAYLVSAFHLCLHFDRIQDRLTARMPHPLRRVLSHIADKAKHIGAGYLKSALILALVTALQLYLGFLLMDQPYALLLATLIALVDLLPVLGAGMILGPWALFCFLTHRSASGIALLAILLLITVTRQILEPKLVGRSVGLSPILTLSSMYAGWYLFGFRGMILLPPLVTLGKWLIPDKGEQDPPSDAKEGGKDAKSIADR